MGADINLGLGEYITLYVLAGVFIIAILGWVFGVALGGALLFAIVAAVGILLAYAAMSRMYRFLLHGSIRAGGEGGGDTDV